MAKVARLVVALLATTTTVLTLAGPADADPSGTPQTITFTAPGTNPSAATVGDAPVALMATSDSHLPVSFSIDPSTEISAEFNEPVCGLGTDGVSVVIAHAGTCVVNADQQGDATYAPADTVQQTIAIAQAAQSIDFTVTSTSGQVGGYQQLAGTATSNLDVSYTIITTSGDPVCDVQGTLVYFDHLGTCRIQADQPGNSDYSAAAPVTQQIVLTQGGQEIDFDPLPSGVVGDTNTLDPTASSGLDVTLSVVTPVGDTPVCSVDSSNALTYLHVGTCVIDADQAGNDDYAAADTVTQQIVIGQSTQQITLAALPDGVVGDTNTLTTPTSSSGLEVTLSVVTPDGDTPVCTVSDTNVLTYLHAGTCVVAADQAGDDDYSGAHEQQSVDIGKATAAISEVTAPPIDKVIGQTVTLTPTSASDGPFSYSMVGGTTGTCTVDPAGVVTLIHAGNCTVDITQGEGTDYVENDTAQLVVAGQASTSAAIAVAPHAIQATIAVVAPGAGDLTGADKAQFLLDGDVLGTADVSSDGVATLNDTVPAGKEHQVAVHYLGSSDFLDSSASTARNDPTLTAVVSSTVGKSRSGWYRTPVSVTFTCTPTTASLATSCPGATTLSASQAAQTVTRTISATDGGIKTLTVSGINIDRAKPKVLVAGVTNGNTYIGRAPSVRCLSSDALSGVQSCKLVRTAHASGVTTYRATATDKAGNVATITGSYRVQRFYLREAIYDASNNSYIVQTGSRYTLVGLAYHRPSYLRPVRVHHAPHVSGGKLARTGSQAKLPRWTRTVTFRKSLNKHTFWVIGVKAAGVLHRITIRVG